MAEHETEPHDAIKRAGWTKLRQEGSHITFYHPKHGYYTFSYHPSKEIWPGKVAKIARAIGLKPEDL